MKKIVKDTAKTDVPTNNILIVDDTPNNLRLLSQTLIEEGYKVRCALNASMALLTIKSKIPDLILLDVNMPDIDGFEVCQQLKMSEITRDIPIIFISASGRLEDKLKAFESGGVDYISKPLQIPELLSRVSSQLNLQNLRNQLLQKNQLLQIEIYSRLAAETEIRQLNFDLERRVEQRTLELQTEIKQRQKMQEELEYIAWHNTLTVLPNRLWLVEMLKNLLSTLQTQPDAKFTTIILDCNRFKIINDSLGRQAGDRLLKMVSDRLLFQTSDNNIELTHFGEDKFAILLEDVTEESAAIAFVQELQKSLALAFTIEHREIFINFNIGIVVCDSSFTIPNEIFRAADLAIQQAKNSSGHYYRVFDATIQNNTLEILELETDLRIALQRQEFHLNYQPIISLGTGTVTGFEALLRWNHPGKGFISPAKFIPVAEQTSLILPLGIWILESACQQIREWQERLQGRHTDFTVSINISAKQFEQEDFVEQLDRIIADTNIDTRHLKLEITETLLIDNTANAERVFRQLQERKIQLAIDDFGTGYSSLSYLDRFPADTLKIDRSFVSRVNETNQTSTIVKATLELAHNLGFNVVAEGVETQQQADQLRDWGCEFAQGYFYAKPMGEAAAWQFLLNNLEIANATKTAMAAHCL
ncbi:MAG: EAL domain-containing protein [Cyanobacteria bacterium J06600_6]